MPKPDTYQCIYIAALQKQTKRLPFKGKISSSRIVGFVAYLTVSFQYNQKPLPRSTLIKPARTDLNRQHMVPMYLMPTSIPGA